jgi:FKBP-type peptidyl-prolyl cis-trans isomerase FklB
LPVSEFAFQALFLWLNPKIMKRLFFCGLLLLIAEGLVIAQKTTTKPAGTQRVFKTQTDSFSYALGVQVASFYRQQGIKKINSALLAKAINDIYTTNKSLLSQRDMNLVMLAVTAPDQYQKLKPNLDAGEKCATENKKKPGIITTASGLQYEVITEGTGEKPAATDSVTCNYKGVLLDGTEFDNSYKRGQPITFSLTRVIRGWSEGLQLMKTGSKYKLYVPYDLGYGESDYGQIPGGSTLVFEIELLAVKKGNAANQ